MKSKAAWARSLIAKFQEQKVLIVGDLMLDRYIYGTVNRISPEAPVPVVRVTNEKNTPGGAANTARNVRSLGGDAVLAGIVGQDQPGRDLLAVLAEEGVSTEKVISLPYARTTVKTRILAGRQQVVRIDWDESLDLPDDERQDFCRSSATAVQGVSGVIIEDYAGGCVRQDVVTAVLAAARQRGVPVALDPKANSDLNVEGITVATPNRKEAFALAGMPERPSHDNPLRDEPLLKAADLLMAQWKPEFLIITLGAQGMLLVSRDHAPQHIPTVAREVFDVSGAGDTVIAATVLALSAGADHNEVAELANCAAGVVVGKVGTASCTGKELLAFQKLLESG